MSEELNIDPELGTEAEIKAARLVLFRKAILQRATDYIGIKSIKYQSPDQGTDSVSGFDCSGFVSHIVGQVAQEQDVSINIPRHANEQWRKFGEFVSYRQKNAGDLVFFPSKTVAGIRVIGHVGIVLDSISYVHAPGKEGTVIRVDELPEDPVELDGVHPNDIYTHSPAGIKRISLPIGNGRWHVQ